jgi:hypothetical protein
MEVSMADDTDDDVLEENGAQEEQEKTGCFTKFLKPICVTIVVLAAVNYLVNPSSGLFPLHARSGLDSIKYKLTKIATAQDDDDAKRLLEFFENKRFTYFSTNCPTYSDYYSFTTTKWQYDKEDRPTQAAVFGVDGNPCLCEDGFATVKYQYKDKGRWMEISFFDLDGNPCLCVYGYTKVRFQTDSKRRWMEVSCFDLDGKLCLHEDGYATLKRQYNGNKWWVQESYFDVDGKPCLCGGIATVKFQYDANGNCLEESYFGKNKKPCMSIFGCATLKHTYDDNGNCVQSSVFDADGKPCVPRNPKQN